MTVLEAIQANPVFSGLSENYINTILGSRLLDGSATYNESSLKDVELVSADLYVDVATLPEFKEGQLSVKYDVSLLKQRARALYLKHGDPKLDDLKPQPIQVGISDGSHVA